MENNEIMVNEDVLNAVEETVTSSPKCSVANVAFGAVVGLVVVGFVYKKFIKPRIDKAKAKKEAKRNLNMHEEDDVYDGFDINEDAE